MLGPCTMPRRGKMGTCKASLAKQTEKSKGRPGASHSLLTDRNQTEYTYILKMCPTGMQEGDEDKEGTLTPNTKNSLETPGLLKGLLMVSTVRVEG